MLELLTQSGIEPWGIWLITWGMHSTLLLTGTWLVTTCKPMLSTSVQERLWKTAVLGGFLTTTLQTSGVCASICAFSLWTKPFATPTTVASRTEERWTLPVSVSTPVSIPRGVERANERLSSEVPVQETPVIESSRSEQLRDAERLASAPIKEATVPTTAPANLESTWAAAFSQKIYQFMGVAGLLCLLAGGLRWFRSTYSTWELFRSQRHLLHGPAVYLFRDLCRLANVRRQVTLFVSEIEEEPCAGGVLKPYVVIPRRALRELTTSELRNLMSHELAHLVRRDPAWLSLLTLVQCLFPFQPLLWVARRRWKQVAELECDTLAVGWTGQPLVLAECLTRVMGWKLSRRWSFTLSTLGRPSELGRRVQRLLEEFPTPQKRKSQRRTQAVWMGAILLVLAGVTLAGPQVRSRYSPETRSDSRQWVAVDPPPQPAPIDPALSVPSGPQEPAQKPSVPTNVPLDPFSELHLELAGLIRETLKLPEDVGENLPHLNPAEREQRLRILKQIRVLKQGVGELSRKGTRLPHSLEELRRNPAPKGRPPMPVERRDDLEGPGDDGDR